MLEYSALTLEHFDRPRNASETTTAPADFIELKAGLVENGMVIRFFVKLVAKPAGIMIEQITFKAYGDVALIACCSLVTELVKNHFVTILNEELSTQLKQQLQLPTIKQHYPTFIVQLLQELQH